MARHAADRAKVGRQNLDAAFTQGNDYFHGLTNDELPHYVIVSDFARIRLVDVDGDQAPQEFDLKDLPKHIERFGNYKVP